ncbi:hypothetical protein LTR94_030688, partial [Friedmanniomyces endolithicus]
RGAMGNAGHRLSAEQYRIAAAIIRSRARRSGFPGYPAFRHQGEKPGRLWPGQYRGRTTGRAGRRARDPHRHQIQCLPGSARRHLTRHDPEQEHGCVAQPGAALQAKGQSLPALRCQQDDHAPELHTAQSGAHFDATGTRSATVRPGNERQRRSETDPLRQLRPVARMVYRPFQLDHRHDLPSRRQGLHPVGYQQFRHRLSGRRQW